MEYGRIDNIDKDISRIFMGSMAADSPEAADRIYGHFLERGGNAFDTAYIYRGGESEKLLGEWIERHGLRDEVVILGKGAHTPHCTPKGLNKELKKSLKRLRTDHVDIYMLHRDNPEVPVGEFVDAVNEHIAAGRIGAWGGSNWDFRRVDAANAYAREHGLRGMAALSNNFSLARMVEPVWDGCIASSEPAYREWHVRTRTPLIAWSSQARGFFTERAHPDKRSDEQLVRSWYSEDNFRRQARAREMAARKGVEPINVALAYVLCQPFPTFPIIGPENTEETESSLVALDVELSPEELDWLNLESEE
ncbi:MAG: aldo/keto reductase [Candidatus Brocadiia bacterium]